MQVARAAKRVDWMAKGQRIAMTDRLWVSDVGEAKFLANPSWTFGAQRVEGVYRTEDPLPRPAAWLD